jgi:hypothetical protein
MESKSSYHDDHHDFGGQCAAATNHHYIKKRTNFLCCVDGSTFGDYTLQNAFNLRKKHDHVTVFHAFKDTEDEDHIFPVEYRPKEMKLKYECELVGHIPSSCYSMWWTSRNRDGKTSAVDELKNTMRDKRHDDDFPDFILMGHVGRKGKKDTQTTLGSNSDASLRGLYLPVIIVKKPCPPTNRKFMMAVNGSIHSERGLDVLLSLIKPKDTLILFHIYTATSDEKIEDVEHLKKKYEGELDLYGPVNSSFELVEKDQGKPLTHVVAEYVNDADPDFLGICPRGKATLSSLSEYVINNVYCSVVCCKN